MVIIKGKNTTKDKLTPDQTQELNTIINDTRQWLQRNELCEKEKYDEDHNIWLKLSLTFSTVLILLYFISPSQLIDVVSRINII